MGQIYGVDDDGIEHRIGSDGFSLSVMEQRKQQDEISAAWEPHRVRISGALDTLEEEVAVLRMTFGGGPVTAAAQQVARAADLPVGDPLELMTRVDALNAAVAWLWKVANGEVDPD